MSEELKPCPFCMALPKADLVWRASKLRHLVYCGNDYCFVNPLVTGDTPQQAAERWDDREGKL